MERRIGVYICHCGTNIAATVNVEEVAGFARNLEAVVLARDYKFMCSDTGQALIRKDIEEQGLNRVVVACCSPRMHEPTFRQVCQEAGLNPYLFEHVNIREHCSWVHKDGATEKAKRLVAAGVRKAYYHQPLEPREVQVNPDTLVVGAGIAGIQAALHIANAGHKVYLVEKEPSIGGHMIQLDKTFPTLDCSACILTPKMAEVGSHPNIQLMAWSEVEEVSGFIGNFAVKIRKKARYVDENKCTGCATCIEKCPWKTDSEFDMGLSKRKAIYIPFPQAVPNVATIDKEICVYFKTGKCRACEKFCQAGAVDFTQEDSIIEVNVGSIILATGYDTLDPSALPKYGYKNLDNILTGLEFERMVNASGPTEGKILLRDGQEPKSVAIVQCVGSRDDYYEYCSRVCCMYALKFSHLIREKTDAEVCQIYRDMRCFGKNFEDFRHRLEEERVNFVKGKVAQVSQENGKLNIMCEDTLPGSVRQVSADMVILCAALQPRSNAEQVARLFTINQKADGFFMERHVKLAPVATPTDGIFIAGCCQEPKDIPDTVVQASAAASQALAMINKGKVEIEPTTSVVNEEICSGCKTCVSLCPFNAISFIEEKRVAQINEALCKGCGVCAAACPSGAITAKHFATEQLMPEIEELLV
ncbi:MAG: CoB--CoM heterodisulfide reductase iron-sulfur subunit A family protein [Dehalococcoidia bacterium]|nr:CoB--CoM heterodisulfide reductase iron-sulfur subunit A family protein [Dehalococcoidia bacterium]